MIKLFAFSADVRFSMQGNYCICSHLSTHVEVLIRPRLKELIEMGEWSHLLPEDLEEIHSLHELGFLVRRESPCS